ncbi:MAG: DUF4426 domain-containing protein [Rhodanobacteraceae bacterium]
MQASLRHHFAFVALIAALLLLCVPRAAAAGQSERFGNYVVYYSALSTDMLTPDVARAYGLVRSSHQGLINIAIKRAATDGDGTSVTGVVRGSAVNLSGQRVPVEFHEVRDGEAIYYLGTFPISGSDTIRFELAVAPQGDVLHRLSFSRDYVVD